VYSFFFFNYLLALNGGPAFLEFFIYTKKLHENKLAAKIETFLEGRFKTVDHGRIFATCVVEQTI
jgi:hypothetical protein